MISYILRERFGLRIGAERRKAVLPQADEALANWSIRLPDCLRLHALNMDPWSAMLHLSYNNFLILLHRPHPRASAYSDDYGPHDAEICSAAAGVIASISEGLRQGDQLKFLWCSGVYALFTAMLQVRVELRFSNPVLAINALRRFDSTLYSLRELSHYWSSAKTILRLFEQSKRLQQDLRIVNSSIHFSVDQNVDSTSTPDTDSPAFTLTAGPSQANKQSSHQGQTKSTPHNQTPTGTSSEMQPAETWIPGLPPAPRNELGEADHICNILPVEQLDQPREYSDWRQLFAFTGTEESEPIAPEGFSEMEDEWRELYWQEPQMSDLLQDGGWMHG
jgi:transcriptional regulatory protein AMDR